jgi:hypothetical protein
MRQVVDNASNGSYLFDTNLSSTRCPEFWNTTPAKSHRQCFLDTRPIPTKLPLSCCISSRPYERATSSPTSADPLLAASNRRRVWSTSLSSLSSTASSQPLQRDATGLESFPARITCSSGGTPEYRGVWNDVAASVAGGLSSTQIAVPDFIRGT